RGGAAGPGLAGPGHHRPTRGARHPHALRPGYRTAREIPVDYRIVEPLKNPVECFRDGEKAMRIRWRGLELPSRVICNRETLTGTFGEFHVEPFERGFGHTVGNSLRRILLSSLEGSAITKIKILGVQHEFSSIPGMVDDITDLVLNVKLLVVKNHSEAPKTLRIDRDRRGVVTAADILHDESVEIINPDHILCTLTDDVPFHMEMNVENGRGYRTAAEGHTDDLEIGVIPIDAS